MNPLVSVSPTLERSPRHRLNLDKIEIKVLFSEEAGAKLGDARGDGIAPRPAVRGRPWLMAAPTLNYGATLVARSTQPRLPVGFHLMVSAWRP
jgi:hypothetical protein